MMFQNPFFRFPYHSYSMRYPSYGYPYSYSYANTKRPSNPSTHYATQNTLMANPPVENSKKEEPSHEDRGFFELLGIKLYFDDILLICLIFFLYTEGVQDEMLFLALILLLLS